MVPEYSQRTRLDLVDFSCASIATASTAANMMSIQPSVVATSKSVSSACGVESKRCTIVVDHLREPATTTPSAQHSHTSRDVGVAANLAKLAGGQTGGALVESVTAPLTMTQHGWDTLYAEYKESGE